MTRRAALSFLLLSSLAIAQEVPTAWHVVESTEGASPGAVTLLRADVARAGWRLSTTGTQPAAAPDAMTLREERLTCRFDRPTLVVVPRSPQNYQATLDDRFQISIVPIVDAASDARGAVLVPAGLHVVAFHEIDHWTPLLRFWGITLFPLVLFAAIFAWASRFGRDPGGMTTPRRFAPWWTSAGLFAAVSAAWWWVLDLPLIAVDYDHVHVFPALIAGDDPFGPLGPVDGRDRPIADSSVFRPWQYLVHGLITIASGASSWWLHLGGVLMHAGGAVAIYRLLLRLLPRGAWVGALAGCTLPLPAQSLTWVNAHALPQCLLAAFAAWLCAVRYLESGRRRDLVLTPILLWIAATTKETGLPLAVAMPVVAALVARRLPWRRLGLLVLATALVMAAWRICRVLSEIPFSLETYGMTFDSSADVLMHGLRRLPELLQEAVRPTAMTDVPEAGLETTAALASDATAGSITARRDLGRWLAPDPVWWTVLGGWTCLALVKGSTVVRATLLLGLPLCVAMAIPDGLHHAPVPALIRKVHPFIVPALALVVAGGLQAASTRAWKIAAGVLLVGTLVIFVPAHGREAATWRAFAEVPIAWVDAVRTACAKVDGRPAPTPPLGPPAVIVVGHPPHLGFDSLLGPTMAGYQQPPLAHRRWTGDHVRERAAAADSEVLLHWPWEVVVMESDGSVCPPTQKRILPPRRPPAAAEVVPLEDAFTVRSRTPWRSVGAIELRWSSALPAGAVIGVEGGPNPVTLTRGLAADQALRLEPSHAGRSPLDAGDVVIDFVTRGSVPAPSRVSVTRGLPEIVWVTEQRSEVPHGAPLPTLTWRLPFETPDGWRLCVRANGAEFSTRIPALDLRLPDDAVDGDGDVHTSGFLASYADVWASTLEHVRAARPDVAAFWLEVTVEAIRGSPSWPLARSRPLFLRVRLRP